MSFDELFNPGARHLQDELEAERILPVPIPVDRAHVDVLPDLGVTMPGLDRHAPSGDDKGESAAADSPLSEP